MNRWAPFEWITAAKTEVVHGIDLTLGQGEFAALIGPSGSGKSTLFNLIGLLDRPTGGIVFQFHHLLPAFTAQENVMLPLLAARGRRDDAMYARAAHLIAEVGLTPWATRRPNDLSGGQRHDLFDRHPRPSPGPPQRPHHRAGGRAHRGGMSHLAIVDPSEGVFYSPRGATAGS